jgi:hypothetical protein
MTNIFIALAVGGLLYCLINWIQKITDKGKKNIIARESKNLHFYHNSEEDNSQRTVLNRISTLESKVNRNEINIQFLENSDEQKKLQIDQMHGWFGSMIRHSAEEPFKKEAIEKFLAEEELKSDDIK